MSNINLLPSNTQVNKAWTTSVPTGITTTAAAAEAAMTAKSSSMGQTDFLTLFTTQLKNQDPLDPVKNEAFVAQLAQFSQLEATTNMSGSLSTFVESMSSSQITSSANLIGGKVAVPDGPATLANGAPVKGVVNLPAGADGVQFKVYDTKGILVKTQILGSQTAGDMTWTWDGRDDAGNALPDGSYRFGASVVSQGKVTNPSISTMAKVIGVSQEADKTMLLQIEGGKTVKLSDVKRIDG